MLFEPDRHEPLRTDTWDDTRAHDALRAIVHDIEQHADADGGWPMHPLDDEGDTPPTGFKTLYIGRAGVWWALAFLQREGAVALASDPVRGIERAHAAYLDDPDGGQVRPSYYVGEAGLLLVQWRLTGSREVADRLHACVAANVGNPANEAFWGAPGTMGAAWHLWAATGESRWRDLFLENVEALWRTWEFDTTARCHLWTQDIHGKSVQYLGAGHGFAGNARALLQGVSLLDDARRDLLLSRCVQALAALARTEDGAVNWPPGTYTPRPGGAQILMQWCHGAPGIVTSFADVPVRQVPALDALLAGAGEAIWRAGPLAKGGGLCHGTAGNGAAFLMLHRRTGDRLWLDRARAFALHALAQCERARATHGNGRYTLWTGDAGLAVFLWQCLRGTAGMPALDLL
jgi:hypothetical protein